jgi:hypothetical protein
MRGDEPTRIQGDLLETALADNRKLMVVPDSFNARYGWALSRYQPKVRTQVGR